MSCVHIRFVIFSCYRCSYFLTSVHDIYDITCHVSTYIYDELLTCYKYDIHIFTCIAYIIYKLLKYTYMYYVSHMYVYTLIEYENTRLMS